MSCNFIFPEVRINPEYRFDEVMSSYNYNFSLIQSGCTGGGFSGVTSIVAGSNILTGGTVEFPVISLSDDVYLLSLSAETFYSGSTPLDLIFAPYGSIGDTTRVQPGTNITTGGTGNFPIVNVVDSPINTAPITSSRAGLPSVAPKVDPA